MQAFAKGTARMLLAESDLPSLFRVHACMVLGCNNDCNSDCLKMAEQGVRTAELIISDRAGEPSDLEMRLHKDTKAVLKADQEAYDKHENETQGKGKGDDQTECGAAERMEEEEERDKCEQRKMMSWSEAPTGRIEEDPSEMSGGFSSFDGPELPQVVESER